MTDMMQPYNDIHNKEQEKILIKEYKKTNKIICIYHSRDLDGWMSAAIVKKWYLETYGQNARVQNLIYHRELVESNTILELKGWDYGDDIPNLEIYNKVIMCDISFPSKWMVEKANSDKSNFIWIDHHKSAIEENKWELESPDGFRDTDSAACELTWKYFFPLEEMPEIVRLLGRYDCFGHKGTSEELSVMEFQYGARAVMFNYEDCYEMLNTHPKLVEEFIAIPGKHMFKYVCSEAQETYKKSFPISFPKNSIPESKLVCKYCGCEEIPKDTPYTHYYCGTTSYDDRPDTFKRSKECEDMTYNFLAVNQERFNPINFDIDYHKEGYDGYACFWYKNGKWSWSLYNDNGETDCSIIAKQYKGGGHPVASGFVLSPEDNEELLKSNKRYTVSGLNLSKFNKGDKLYLDPNKPGTLINKK